MHFDHLVVLSERPPDNFGRVLVGYDDEDHGPPPDLTFKRCLDHALCLPLERTERRLGTATVA
jgi:hypothetical protein